MRWQFGGNDIGFRLTVCESECYSEFMRKKGFAYVSILGILLLLLVLPVAVFLVRQREGAQNVGSKAAEPSSPSPLVTKGNGLVVDSGYVDFDVPTKRLDGSKVLWVDGSSKKIAYLKFDLSSLQVKVNFAKLRLFVTHGSRAKQTIREVVGTSSWRANSLTFQNRPDLGKVLAVIEGGEQGKWVEVDVTSFVNANAGEVVSVGIESNSVNGLGVSSLGAPSNRPELVVN